MKQRFALEDLDQTDTETEINAYAENLEKNGSGSSNNRIASMTIDFYKDKTNCVSRYVELPKKISISKMQNKLDNLCGFWCIIAR